MLCDETKVLKLLTCQCAKQGLQVGVSGSGVLVFKVLRLIIDLYPEPDIGSNLGNKEAVNITEQHYMTNF